MATYYARASGNIDTAIWATTPSGVGAIYYPFTASDILVCNGFTVTVNINTTVAQIRSVATSNPATFNVSFMAIGV